MNNKGLLLVISAMVILAACQREASTDVIMSEAEDALANKVQCVPETPPVTEPVEIAPGLMSLTTKPGCGDIARQGHIAIVHYTGWLLDEEAPDQRGEKFDSSKDRDQHFKFPVGAGRVIKGWDQGVAGMAVGETRVLTIAPEMAYGNRDNGVIPPGSTLIFEVELAGLAGRPD